MMSSDFSSRNKIESLRPISGPGWTSGPYSEESIVEVEKRVGRSLQHAHRELLLDVGGSFSFEFGAVTVGQSTRNVSVFFGAGEDDYNIAGWFIDYAGQIPHRWYPFASDSDGQLYCLTSDDAVHHIELEEELWTRASRPRSSGTHVANGFIEFISSLRLPDWAVAYLAEHER